MNFVSTPVRAAVLGLLASVSVPAFSQGATLKETVVTANRYEQDVQSAPSAITVLTSEQILSSGATDANDAISRLIGLPSRIDLNGARNNTLDFRGFGETASQNVVVVVDGIRISENEQASPRLSAISPEQIESIEIVRGGSSVQWGEGASAGVINIVLKKNTKQGLSGSATAQLESFNGRDGRANFSVGTEGLVFDANVRSYATDSYRENGTARQDTASVGLSGASGNTKFRMRVSSEDQTNRFAGPLSLSQFKQNPTQAKTPKDFGSYAETRATLGFEYLLDKIVFAVDTGVRNKNVSYHLDYDGYPTIGGTSSSSYQLSPKATYRSALGKNALTLVGGQDYSRWNYKAENSNPQNEQSYQFNNATYFSGDFLTNSGTRLVVGIRQETVNKRAEDRIAYEPVDYNRSDNLDAWDFGLSQEIKSGINAYFKSAKSYRLPNVDENRTVAMALRPQSSRDIEFGVKWSLNADNYITFRTYEQNTTDEIAFNRLCGSMGCNTNLDPTRRQGAELEGRLALQKNLRLQGSLQTVDAKFREGPFAGKQIPSVASISTAVRLLWLIDTQQSLNFGVQYLGGSRLSNDIANRCSAQMPDRTLLDARYAWNNRKIEVSLSAINLTDEKSYSYGITNADCSAVNVYPDPGRTLKATVKYNF